MIRYACPFCYKTMPSGYEPSVWVCCGKAGRATIFPECPKCHAEILDGSDKCVICGFNQSEAEE